MIFIIIFINFYWYLIYRIAILHTSTGTLFMTMEVSCRQMVDGVVSRTIISVGHMASPIDLISDIVQVLLIIFIRHLLLLIP